MTSEGELWKRQRYMMQPFFHRRVITEFADCIARRQRALHRALGGPQPPAASWSTHRRDERAHARDRAALDLRHGPRPPTGSPAATRSRSSPRTGRNLQFAFKFRSLAKLVAGLIAQRRRARAESISTILGMLMDARDKETGEPMTERELIDEVMTLVVAGHETTASGLNWTWYLLSQHPEVDARMHAEIDAAPELPAPEPGADGVAALHPAGHQRGAAPVPPGWLLSRRTHRGGRARRLCHPAGTDVLLRPYLLHRHPQFWKEPERFRPERFDAASTRPNGRASPTCPSRPARATASANPWRFTRC